jgi:hypothetical protein
MWDPGTQAGLTGTGRHTLVGAAGYRQRPVVLRVVIRLKIDPDLDEKSHGSEESK